jgi:hypothetical protein
MRLRNPGLLLLLYLFLPVKTAAIGQILLCQFRSICAARQAEEQLHLELDKELDIELEPNLNEVVRNLLRSLWFDRGNTLAYAYIKSIAPQLGLDNYDIRKIRHKVAKNKIEFSNHAVSKSIMYRIGITEIREIIANGYIVSEYFNDKYHMGYLIYGLTQSQRSIHIKCSHFSRSLIKIIAVHELDSERGDSNIIRRENNDG